MKNFFVLVLFVFSINFANASRAGNLFESLHQTFLNNTKLNAERANFRASQENKNEALGEFKPSISISAYLSEQDNSGDTDSNFTPSEQSLLIEQKIFQSFGGVAGYEKEKYEIQLAEYNLKKIEQEVLLAAVEVHTNLILNKNKVKINFLNVDLLERQVETDKSRLERGEINLTDLSQSEASLAGARAKLITSQNSLVTSIANYEKIVGKAPRNIDENGTYKLKLPKSISEAYKIAKDENPDLNIAILELEKAKQDIIIARSKLSPAATLSYKIAEQDDFSSTVQNRTQQTFKATATWPLYSGGSNLASLRKAKELKNQKELLLEDSKKIINASVTNEWSSFESLKSLLDSIKSQVKAAEIANEGITVEYESGGNRTTLEVIQSRSILLDSRISLATSERDYLLSQFKLLSAIGRLTAKGLKLKSN